MELNKTQKACEFAEECVEEFKKIIHAPLFYTEIEEDGSRTTSYTTFGQKLFDIVYDKYKNTL